MRYLSSTSGPESRVAVIYIWGVVHLYSTKVDLDIPLKPQHPNKFGILLGNKLGSFSKYYEVDAHINQLS